MQQQKFVTYVRVSTQRQGISGLGLEAQRYAVAEYLGAKVCDVVGEYIGSPLASSPWWPRPRRDAISTRCREAMAAAKRRGVKFGNPSHLTNKGREKGRRIVHQRRRTIAQQRAWDLTPIIREMRVAGARTHQDLIDGLNARGIPPTGRGPWNEGRIKALLHLVDDKPSLQEALALIRAELRHRGGHRDRNAQIYRDRLAGRTLTSLALEHGLTDERIRQLCTLAAARRIGGRWSGTRKSPTDDVELRTYLEQLLMDMPEGGTPDPRRRSRVRADGCDVVP